MHIVGDVKDRDVLIVDDLIDTAGTLTQAARAVTDAGARRVLAAAAHGVLSGKAIERVAASPLQEIVFTDSIPLTPEGRALSKIHQVSVARLLGEAIKRIHHGDSISSLFV
jgi:ribose-phosphate pyrophosphokinase